MPASKWTVLDTLPAEDRQQLMDRVGIRTLVAAGKQQDVVPINDIIRMVDVLSDQDVKSYLASNGIVLDEKSTDKDYKNAFDFMNSKIGTDYKFESASKMSPDHRWYSAFKNEKLHGGTDPRNQTIYVDTGTDTSADTVIHELGHGREKKQSPNTFYNMAEQTQIPVQDALNGLSAIEESRWGSVPLKWEDDTKQLPFMQNVAQTPFWGRDSIFSKQHLAEENRPYNLLNQLQGLPTPETTYLPQDIPLKKPTIYQRSLDKANLERTAQITGLRDLLNANHFNAVSDRY